MWRGTLLNELINLPIYWWKVFRVDTSSLQVQKRSYGSHARQYFLHAQPTKVSQKTIVVYLHGGGWWLGKPEQFVQNAMFFTSLGYEVYLPSYRRVPKYDIHDMRDDLITAMTAIREAYGTAELPKILLAGMSAGGHLASLLALDQSMLASAGWPKHSVHGLISWCSPLDLTSTTPSLPQHWLCRNLTQENHHLVNPAALVDRSNVNFPILVIYGSKDGMVNLENSLNFIKRCRKEGVEILVNELPKTHLQIATWSIPNSVYWNLSKNLMKTADITKG